MEELDRLREAAEESAEIADRQESEREQLAEDLAETRRSLDEKLDPVIAQLGKVARKTR